MHPVFEEYVFGKFFEGVDVPCVRPTGGAGATEGGRSDDEKRLEEAALSSVETLSIWVDQRHRTRRELVRAADQSIHRRGHRAAADRATRLRNYVRHELTRYDVWCVLLGDIPRARERMRELIMGAADHYIDQLPP